MKMKLLTLCFCLTFCFIHAKENGKEDFYKLLGVSRDASVRDIRKAFKTLAVKYHPDKNREDQNADEKFVKLAHAYEILKDAESRKLYDLYGDTGTPTDTKQTYRSYSYYKDVFGIYDDDPFIVTLSQADYEANVLDNTQTWFVNFYSPHCHHCHELAPIWRKLSELLEGVVRVAAVNCEEDWALCHQLSIHSYPTLLYYEKEAHLYEGELYRGPRTLEAFQEFILSKLTVSIERITSDTWNGGGLRKKQWLLFLCPDHSSACPEYETQIKLAAILEGLMSVGLITDADLCGKISESYKQSPVVFWQVSEEKLDGDEAVSSAKVHEIISADTKEIVDEVLGHLPNPEELSEEMFRDVRVKLRSGECKAWLLCFFLGPATELNIQLKRLVTMVSNVNIGLINCGRNSALCGSLHVSHYPSWGALKDGGAFEMHLGREVLHEVAAFARDSIKSTNFHALSPADFYNIVEEGSAWFIDWYAPWCPPCRKLMPEVRRASQHFTPEIIQFGTIDCTLHAQLCSKEGIRSYPTTAIYNASKTHYFHGKPNEESIIEFVHDMISPVVILLDNNSFAQLLRKPVDELWIVDFFAPWCGPCQRLAPEWRALAKELDSFRQVKVAQVDCVANVDLCNAQNVRSYPTIRMYPLGSKGLNSVAMYNGHRDMLAMKSWVFSFLPSPVESLDPKEFRKQILTKKFYLPWLIDFYAPWCSHCVHFEPDFITVAQRLEGQVRNGKVDCDRDRDFCREVRVTSYPTVMLYLSPTERYEISSRAPKDIIRHVKNLIKQHTHPRDEL